MRHVFVNPSKRRRKGSTRKRRGRTRRQNRSGGSSLARQNAFLKGKVAGMATRKRSTTRRRRRRSAPRRRRRRRNAGVTSFVRRSNPRMARPRRRYTRRRRSNPGMSGRLTVKNVVNRSIYLGAGSAIGAGANILAINKIENVWARNGTRVGAAVLGGMLLKGIPSIVSASAAGALLYPMWQEVYAKVMSDSDDSGGGGGGGSEPSEADLDYMAADLEQAMGATF